MFNTAGTSAITFNGEIYGYREIKKQISNYKFQTNSDTEVILALYDKHGAEFVKELPGMFAFALWDDASQTLIAARDRFGEKPFYYATAPSGEFVFASEIKAILASGLIAPELSGNALAHYFHKLHVGPLQTIYSTIHVLPPGHTLVYQDGKLAVSRYWQMPKTRESITLQEALPEFKRLFTDAVRRQLVADVTVGAFLSGGLDSTTIVSVASQFSPKIKTFAFGFRDSKNELPFARMAAEKYGTEHHEMSDSDYDIATLLPKMAEVYDEPFADSSNIPTYLISEQTRRHATVALSGDGGDELLGGYSSYRPLLPQTWFAQLFAKAPAPRNVYFSAQEIAGLGAASPPEPPLLTNPDDAMRDDVIEYLPGDILVKTDRASMAHGLELRAPFLDQPFAEFAASLPYRLKIDKAEDKIILRRAFEETWPEPIRTRGKQGFGAPVHRWLAEPAVTKLLHKHLDDPHKKIFKHISFEASRPYTARGDYKTWILLILSLWMEKHLS